MVTERIQRVPPSGIREFFDLVLGMPDVISLGVGEPDFITPWSIREKAITALEEGSTSYTSNKGLMVLRENIAQHYQHKYSLKYDHKEEILITVGVSEGLDLALRTILNRGDKVIVVSPYYVAYPALVEINFGQPIFLTTKEEEGFKINPKKLYELVKQNPKAIILNYPSNPTGVTYDKEELKEIAKIIAKKDMMIISDEAYDEIIYQEKHYPFSGINEKLKDRTILLNGFSKGYAMTGFRIAYACANSRVIDAMNKIHSFSMLCAPIVSQIAALEALKNQKEVLKMRAEYKRRRDFITKELNRLGLATNIPQGAFYCFSSIKKFNIPAMDFAKKLLFAEKVALVPGTAFGKEFSSHIRISYANTLEDLKEAIARIEKFLGSLN